MVGLAKGIEREELEVEGCDESSVCEYRQTGHLGKCLELKNRRRMGNPYRLSPHLLKHIQWKVCEQGTVMRPVTAESILSKHTGQVGSSYIFACAGPRREIVCESVSSTSIITDRTCTTWQISG